MNKFRITRLKIVCEWYTFQKGKVDMPERNTASSSLDKQYLTRVSLGNDQPFLKDIADRITWNVSQHKERVSSDQVEEIQAWNALAYTLLNYLKETEITSQVFENWQDLSNWLMELHASNRLPYDSNDISQEEAKQAILDLLSHVSLVSVWRKDIQDDLR